MSVKKQMSSWGRFFSALYFPARGSPGCMPVRYRAMYNGSRDQHQSTTKSKYLGAGGVQGQIQDHDTRPPPAPVPLDGPLPPPPPQPDP